MNVEVILLPRDLEPAHLRGRCCAVFDVLRATTTMAAALAAGVGEIRLFDSLPAARLAAAAHRGPRLLCGEEACLRPADFDLGNSPGQFTAPQFAASQAEGANAGAVLFMCTTNGTRALIAAQAADAVFIGALVNARAAARALVARQLDIVLLCAGTAGQVAMEDLIGCGAVLDALGSAARPMNDPARIALRLFHTSRSSLPDVLRDSQGGRNIIAAGLEPDIDFAARLDVFDLTGILSGPQPTIRPIHCRIEPEPRRNPR